MKGIVFTEFFEHVEEKLGYELVDQIIQDSNLEHGGAYTAVGTYPCQEMGQLIGALSQRTGVSSSQLMRGFGGRLATTFHAEYPHYFDQPSFFDFVETLDSRIHVEVLKLYPDAELPKFLTVQRGPDLLIVDYISQRGLHELAHGLFEAASLLFPENIAVSSEPVTTEVGDVVRFRLEQTSGA